MTSRRRPPYLSRTRRALDKQLPLRPGSDAPVGWIYTVEQKLRQVYQEAEGLLLRLGTKYKGGVPACYIGEKLFTPEEASFSADPWGSNAIFPANAQPLNYVVRSGMVHSIPIVINGPGVFVARYLKVSISQRYNFPSNDPNVPGSPNGGVIWFPLPPKDFMNVGAGPLALDGLGWPVDMIRWMTVKWSIFSEVTLPALLGSIGGALGFSFNDVRGSSLALGVNFFWNIIDQDSQRRYADDWVSDNALLRQGSASPVDGNILKFNAPWLFERAGTVDFQFLPITDILQLDPTATIFPIITTAGLPVDDREDNGTKRDHSISSRSPGKAVCSGLEGRPRRS